MEISKENKKLVNSFGANKISDLKEVPNFYTFNNNLVYSHRDFDKFFSKLKQGVPSAIVSGFNASGTIHLGHKPVFDTNLFFQKEYGCKIFIPISDDESYVSGKVPDQETGLKYALSLAKQLLAYGFDPKKTYFIIDQIFTNIYNLAIKLSTKVTLSEIKATYGYTMDQNPGLFFYPAIQSAHILLPQELEGIKNVLVPIGPDEDNHLRICRDIASRLKYEKPAVLHLNFMPGTDGEKMSKSKNNAIFLEDDEKAITKKVNKSLSGGRQTVEEHRKLGGVVEQDMAIQYLTNLFYDKEKSNKLTKDYKEGKILSGEVKNLLKEELLHFTKTFQETHLKITNEEVKKVILTNKTYAKEV
jgi:tryptophanyl-tRNA synthetase